MMFDYLPAESFKAVYVVDLCHSLCETAKAKVKANGWTNVHVVEADACTWTPPTGTADLVTFSYSLSSEWWLLSWVRSGASGLYSITGSTTSSHNQGAATCEGIACGPLTAVSFWGGVFPDWMSAGIAVRLTVCMSALCSDSSIPRRRGQCGFLALAQRIPGSCRLFRQRQVRHPYAPDVMGSPVLLEVRTLNDLNVNVSD